MSPLAEVKVSEVRVPGATLYVEVRGSGPVLLCISGGPTDAGMFGDLGARLADRYTVVSYDQRGHSRSRLDGRPEAIRVALHADDAAEVLRSIGDEPAYVYGNSGGGSIGLELVVRHPELVRTLLVHEPPLLELLPDAPRWRSEFAELSDTYRTQGAFPAMAKFGAIVEEGGPKYSEEPPRVQSPEDQEMMQRMPANFDLFIGHEIPSLVAYTPDVDALTGSGVRIVTVAGETSGEQVARRAAIRLAERLGTEVTYLPGAHGGRGSDPQEYAERLHAALQANPAGG
ncbi:MAG TPA: alpha/beta hydrolase [Solirubrobacteraceae bacterium]|nr:alpha/beta hydrolase [Solirubrobacteraceae bacterium]